MIIKIVLKVFKRVDFVSNPSTHGAFMRPVNEGVENQKPETRIESIINSIMRG